MSLTESGRTGAKVQLTGDTVLGIVTQDPESMLHSPGGLTNADGNSAFGQTFKVMAYFTATTDDSQTLTIATADSPFKFRVLKGTALLIDDAKGVIRSANGRLSVSVLAGSGNTVLAAQLKDMELGEERVLPLNNTGAEVVAENGSFSVRCVSRIPATGATNTLKLLVELTCMRVI